MNDLPAHMMDEPQPEAPSDTSDITQLPPEAKSTLYKTELCRKFQDTAFCRYGDKCQFAHGLDQLRPMPRHPKYKTERCKTFWKVGNCPYGTRCRFLHDETMMTQSPAALSVMEMGDNRRRLSSSGSNTPSSLSTMGNNPTHTDSPLGRQANHSVNKWTMNTLKVNPSGSPYSRSQEVDPADVSFHRGSSSPRRSRLNSFELPPSQDWLPSSADTMLGNTKAQGPPLYQASSFGFEYLHQPSQLRSGSISSAETPEDSLFRSFSNLNLSSASDAAPTNTSSGFSFLYHNAPAADPYYGGYTNSSSFLPYGSQIAGKPASIDKESEGGFLNFLSPPLHDCHDAAVKEGGNLFQGVLGIGPDHNRLH